MDFETIEGIDYIIDFYALIGVEHDATLEEINSAIRTKLSENHPDRFVNVGKQYRDQAEEMVRLIGRAKSILTKREKREAYDKVLKSWDGEISKDGVPILKLSNAIKRDRAKKSPEALEAEIAEQLAQYSATINFDERTLASVETIIEASGDQVSVDLRIVYESILAQQDLLLAGEITARAEVLGLPLEAVAQISTGYADAVVGEITSALEDEIKRKTMLAVGFTERLAILGVADSGEAYEKNTEVLMVQSGTLVPVHFVEQGEKIVELSKLRESVLNKRLDNMIFEYPEIENQPEFGGVVYLGIKNGDKTMWVRAWFDSVENNYPMEAASDEMRVQLDARNYQAAFNEGANVLTTDFLDNVQATTLLNELIVHHYVKENVLKRQAPDVVVVEAPELGLNPPTIE